MSDLLAVVYLVATGALVGGSLALVIWRAGLRDLIEDRDP